MVCVFTTSTVEMIAMIAELRMTCSSSDLSAARLPDASRAGREFFPQVDHTHNRGCSGELYYAPPTLRTDWLTSELRLGDSKSSCRSSALVSGGGSRKSCRPCRHHMATIEALSIPHRHAGAGSRTCQAHGVRSNPRHVPSDEGASDLAKTRFNEMSRGPRDRGSPARERG